MYKYILIIACLSFNIAEGQSFSDLETDNFKLQIEVPVYKSDILGNKLTDTFLIAPEGAQLLIVNTVQNDSDYLVIRFTSLPKNYESDSATIYIPSSQNLYQYYILNNNQVKNKLLPVYANSLSFSTGILIVPLKFRFSPSEFSKDIMIGSTFGVKWRPSELKKNTYLNMILSLGLSHVTINPADLPIGSTSSQLNHPAFSTGIGALLDINQIQYGIFIGTDFIAQQDVIQWSQQGKPWISAGLGISFLRQDGESRRSGKRVAFRQRSN